MKVPVLSSRFPWLWEQGEWRGRREVDRHCFGQPRSLGRERLKVTRDKLRADYSLLASVAQKEVRPAPAFSAPNRGRGAHVRGAWRKTGSGLTVAFIGCSSAREFASEHRGRELARSLAGAWALSPEAAICLGRHLVLRRCFGDLCSPSPLKVCTPECARSYTNLGALLRSG